MAEESPSDLGPFIVMEYTGHDSDICDALNDPRLSTEDRSVLDPDIYRKDSSPFTVKWQIFFSKWQDPFPEIGSITDNEDDEFDVLWITTD